MRYLKEQEFVTAMHGPFRMGNAKGQAGDSNATSSDMLWWLLNLYTPQAGAPPLTLQELRRLNHVVDILADAPQEDGHYRFEEADFEMMRKSVLPLAVVLTPRNAPLIEDMLNACPQHLTQEVADAPNGANPAG